MFTKFPREFLSDLLEKKDFQKLKHIVNDMQPADLAILFDSLEKNELLVVFRLLSKDLASETFAYLDADRQLDIIALLHDTELKEVLDRLFLDDTVDMIEEMPANIVTRILKNTDEQTRKHINELLRYPDDSAGSIMTIEYASFPTNINVGQAILRLRKDGINKETVYTCYVTDNRKLIGLVEVSALLAANDDDLISDIMETNVISVFTFEDRETVARKFSKYGFISLPVVDRENRLVGIVTVDDALEVLKEENTEDFSIMAAMEPIEESYFKTPVFSHAKKRVLWLMVLMISATVTGIIMQKYENAIAAFPVLVGSIPMLMDTGGNSGSQSATMMIRGIALEEIGFADILKAVFKEFRISIIVGICLAVVNFARILLMYPTGLLGEMGGQSPITIALIVSLTLIFVVIIAKLTGCALPLLAHRVGLDPALMASPIISTIVDACAVVIYFRIATLWLDIGI